MSTEYDQPDPVPVDAAALIEEDRKYEDRQNKAEFSASKKRGDRDAEKILEAEEKAARKLVFEPLSSFGKKKSEWLLHHRIPATDLTLIIGKGGAGKSTLLALLCAYITNGVKILDEQYKGGDSPVIYCHSEDSVEETIKPRMEAAGVDMSKVHLIRVETPDGAGMLQIPRDIDTLMESAKAMGVVAIFYDPISSFLRSAIGGRNDADAMRNAYLAIQSAHSDNGIAGIGLGHTRKAASDSLVDAFMGSSEQTNVIRSALGAIPDPDIPERYIISQEKNNKAPRALSYSYRLDDVPNIYDDDGNELEVSKVTITGTTKETCTDVLRAQNVTARREAKQFIIEHLSAQGGSAMANDVAEESTKKGHSKATTYRAAEELVQYGKVSASPDPADGRRHIWQLLVRPEDYAK